MASRRAAGIDNQPLSRNFLFFAPHIAVVPCVLIFIVVLAFNVLGDALRDALDPRLRI